MLKTTRARASIKTTRARASNWSRTPFQNAVFKLSLAEPPEALPDGIPVSECLGQSAPGDIVDTEVVQRFEEPAVVPALVAPPGAHRPEHLNHSLPVRVRHPRQHGRPPQNRPARKQKSRTQGTCSECARLKPSTPPRARRTKPWVVDSTVR